jgi:cell division protein FtsI/penicillin-binding protein 2
MREFLGRFGFNEPIPFELPADESRAAVNDSTFRLAELASGFNRQTRISPLYGALLAAAVSNNGSMPLPTLVDSITDVNTGFRAYVASPGVWRAPIGARAASEVRTMMRAVARYGTARKSFVYVKRSGCFSKIEYGGKTGNIELDGTGRVDWFAGFARDPADPGLSIAVAVVTVHGPYWTVHSGFIGAEMMRAFIRDGQNRSDNNGRNTADNPDNRKTSDTTDRRS